MVIARQCAHAWKFDNENQVTFPDVKPSIWKLLVRPPNPGDYHTGTANLTGLGITIDGANAGDFSVIASPAAPVVPDGRTTFTVRFTPGASGSRTAALHLASNDADESPFDLALTGTGLTRIEAWRQQYFGTIASSGNAAGMGGMPGPHAAARGMGIHIISHQ